MEELSDTVKERKEELSRVIKQYTAKNVNNIFNENVENNQTSCWKKNILKRYNIKNLEDVFEKESGAIEDKDEVVVDIVEIKESEPEIENQPDLEEDTIRNYENRSEDKVTIADRSSKSIKKKH